MSQFSSVPELGEGCPKVNAEIEIQLFLQPHEYYFLSFYLSSYLLFKHIDCDGLAILLVKLCGILNIV